MMKRTPAAIEGVESSPLLPALLSQSRGPMMGSGGVATSSRTGPAMMPVVAGAQSTINQIVAYSIVLAPFAVLPAVMGMTSIVYGVVASMLGLGFLGYALRLKREPSDANAMALFKYSIVYLFLIFLALGLDAILGGFYG